MTLKTFLILVIGVMAPMALSATPRAAELSSQVAGAADKQDPVSGQWTGIFEVEGNKVPVKLTFKLDGSSLTGTAESNHTGPGTLKGSCKDNNLSFTMDFKTHDSVAVTGVLKDGKLSGQFSTEGRQGTWEAEKNEPPRS